MRIDRFTQKMQETLQAAQDLSSKGGHSEIDNEHFLSALLGQADLVLPVPCSPTRSASRRARLKKSCTRNSTAGAGSRAANSASVAN